MGNKAYKETQVIKPGMVYGYLKELWKTVNVEVDYST